MMEEICQAVFVIVSLLRFWLRTHQNDDKSLSAPAEEAV